MTTPPLSQARVLEGVAYTAGQVGIDLATGEAYADLRDEIRAGLRSLGDVLDSVGSSFEQVVRTTVYLTDISSFAVMNEEYVAVFGEPFPARSTIVTDLILPSLRFEIDAIAAVS